MHKGDCAVIYLRVPKESLDIENSVMRLSGHIPYRPVLQCPASYGNSPRVPFTNTLNS